jgi:competence protein ComFC
MPEIKKPTAKPKKFIVKTLDLIIKNLKIFTNIIIDFLAPNLCLSCKEILPHQKLHPNADLASNAYFCYICWKELVFISENSCYICQKPMPAKLTQRIQSQICLECLNKPPKFDKLLTIFQYNQIFKKIIIQLKYRNQSFIAKSLAKILLQKFYHEIIKYDIITPVPLHYSRLRQRKYNQAQLIAKHLNKMVENRGEEKQIIITDLLIRTKNTNSQIPLTRLDRQKNMIGAIKLNEKYRQIISNKKILVVDDVITTGATINQSAKILKSNNAKEVVAITLAKTIF